MIYKDFLAKAATQFMREGYKKLKDADFDGENEEASQSVHKEAVKAIIAAKTLADELIASFDFVKVEDNKKHIDCEDFFDEYVVTI